MSDRTPTETLHAPTAEPPRQPQSRRPLWILGGLGATLLVATVILLVALFTRGGDDSSAFVAPTPPPTSPTSGAPSPGPSPSATQLDPPASGDSDTGTDTDTDTAQDTDGASSAPRLTSFDAPTSEGGCSKGGPATELVRPLVTVSWNSASAISAWYVNGSSDAAAAAYLQIPLAGDETDFEYDQVFPCNQESATFTITLVGDHGEHVSKTWTVENTGDTF